MSRFRWHAISKETHKTEGENKNEQKEKVIEEIINNELNELKSKISFDDIAEYGGM